MHFTKMITENFQGLPGVKTFNFDSTITANIGKNGTGKTSFLNAIRYILTGTEPSGDIITHGTERTSVSLFLDDGTVITRLKSLSKGNKYYINKKPVSASDFNKLLNKTAPMKTMKIVSSSEVIASMSPKDFGNFLLSFANLTTKEFVINSVGEVHDEAKEEIEKNLKSENLSILALNQYFTSKSEERKVLKKSLIEKKSRLDWLLSKGAKEPVMRVKEEILADLEQVRQAEIKQSVDKEKLVQYEKAVKENEACTEKIKRIEEKLNRIEIPDIDITNLEEYQKNKENLLQERIKLLNEESTYKAAISSLEKSIKTLETPVCPLSEKLVCTTDKTPIRNELTEAAEASKEALELVVKNIKDNAAKREACENAINNILNVKALLGQKDALLKQKKAYEDNLKPLSEKPDVTIDTALAERAAALRKELAHYDEYMEYIKCYQDFARDKKRYVIVNDIAEAFAPKGAVKKALMSEFIKTFEAKCNATAEKFSFVLQFTTTKRGLETFVKTDKSEDFIGFGLLSGGEQAKVLYILMDAFSQMSNFKMIFLDELSILDTEGLTELLSIIKQNQDNYDHVFLNAVNYDDIINIFNSFNIVNIAA